MKYSYNFIIKGLIVLVLFMGLSFAVVQPAQAAVIDDDGRIDASEVIDDDLLISADNVVIDGTINGAVIAAGTRIVVNGTINGDLLMFGSDVVLSESGRVDGNIFGGARTIDIRGQVSGSVFGGSASMVLGNNALIERNLYYGGYSLETMSGSVVNIDALAGGYQAILNGEVKRDLRVGAGAVELNGVVGRDAILHVDSSNQDTPSWVPSVQTGIPAAIDPGLRISSGAKIGGNLRYTSSTDQASSIQASPEGQVIYQTPVPDGEEQPADGDGRVPRGFFAFPIFKTIFNIMRNVITLLILGGLALWLIPNVFTRIVDEARNQPLASAGVGFLSLIIGYGGAVLAAILLISLGIFLSLVTLGGLSRTIFGIGFSSLALIMAIFTFLVTYGSKLVVSYLVGNLLMKQIAPDANNLPVWSLVVGVTIYALLRAIPIFGWLIGLGATLVGLGAMWFAYRSWRQPEPTVETSVSQV